MREKRKFFTRLLLAFLLVSFVPVLLLGFVSRAGAERNSLKEIKRQVASASTYINQSITSVLELFETRLINLSRDKEVIQYLKEPGLDDSQIIYSKMYNLLSGYFDSFMFHLLSVDGKVALTTGTIPLEYNTETFKDWGFIRILSNSYKAEFYVNRLTNGDVVSSGIAIREKGKIIGYAIIDMNKHTLERTLSDYALTLPFVYSLIDERGYILFDQIGFDKKEVFVNNLIDIAANTVNEAEVNNRKYILSSTRLENTDFLLYCAVPVDLVMDNNQRIMVFTLFFAIITFSFSVIFSIGFAKSLSRPISTMTQMMKQVEKGNLAVRCNCSKNDELGQLSQRLDLMVEKLDSLFKENLEKQDLLRTAELHSLKAQIDPHFLYNTLDCIRYMIKLGMCKEASKATSDLGILLKNSISNSKDMNTVFEAMHIINSYLEIVCLEHPDKFNIKMDINPNLYEIQIPKLLIQPIVENAIIHGLEDKMGIGNLSIKGTRGEDYIKFEITDDGNGMNEETLALVLRGKSGSVAIQNIIKRLSLYYGDKATLEIKSEVGKGTQVVVKIPYTEDK